MWVYLLFNFEFTNWVCAESTSYTYIISGEEAITWTPTHGWWVCW